MTTGAFDARRKTGVLTPTPAARTSLGDIVAERLREAILDDVLSPGQHLREEEVSESMDVSRGPVRDAFLILEREGLIRLSRHRGATIVALSLNDLGEVYSLRSALESLAVRFAIRRREQEDLDVLAQSLQDMQSAMRRKISEPAAAKLDVAFHDGIFRAAHHERLYSSWLSIRMQVYWFLLSRNVAGPEWRKDMAQGHGRIFELVSTGDEDQAVAAIGEHIRSAYTRICAQLDEQRTDASNSDERQRDMAASFLLE